MDSPEEESHFANVTKIPAISMNKVSSSYKAYSFLPHERISLLKESSLI